MCQGGVHGTRELKENILLVIKVLLRGLSLISDILLLPRYVSNLQETLH